MSCYLPNCCNSFIPSISQPIDQCTTPQPRTHIEAATADAARAALTYNEPTPVGIRRDIQNNIELMLYAKSQGLDFEHDDFVMPYVQLFRNNAKKYTQTYIQEHPSKYSYLYNDDKWDEYGSYSCNGTAHALMRYLKTQNVIGAKPTKKWLLQERCEVKLKLRQSVLKLRQWERELHELNGSLPSSSLSKSALEDQLQLFDDPSLDDSLNNNLVDAPLYIIEHPGINHFSISNKNDPDWGHEFVIVNSGSRIFIVHSNTFTSLKVSDEKGVIEIDQNTLCKIFLNDSDTCDRLFGVSDIEIRINKLSHYGILSHAV